MDTMLKGNLDGITVTKSIEDLNIPVVYLTSYADKKLWKKPRKLHHIVYNQTIQR